MAVTEDIRDGFMVAPKRSNVSAISYETNYIMTLRFLYLSVLFFGLSWPVSSVRAERITLYTGDIYIGKVVGKADARFTIDRFGLREVVPQWFIKELETDVQTLPPLVSGDILSGTRNYRLGGRTIPVLSSLPAETSHLELYSWRAHFWTEKERYFRGYIVNRGDEHFKSMVIQFRFMGANIELDRMKTEIFNCYPKTMKPFIIDTRRIEWSRVLQIHVEVISANKIKVDY
jgi:hypothetical protein